MRKSYRASAGQLIYSKLFGWEGSVAVVPDDMDGSFVSSEFPTFDVDLEKIDIAYLGQVIRSTAFMAQLSESTTGMGQRRQRVNVEDFLRVQFPLPSIEVQRRVGQSWRKSISRIDSSSGRPS